MVTNLSVSVLLALVATASVASAAPNPTRRQYNQQYHSEVLGPLNKITDWNSFANQLRQLKLNGVQAIATDIWWGDVEPQDQTFNWSYYRTLANTVRASGLKWVPIMSTHQCGGSGTTECNIPIPTWYENGMKDADKYTSITGQRSREASSPWAVVNGKTSIQEMGELYTAFAEEFKDFADIVPRVDLSGGGSGELRYPSYSMSWTYPERGHIMAYNDAAVASFQNKTLAKYGGSLANVNAAWGAALTSTSQITPPCDTVSSSNVVPICRGQAVGTGFWTNNGWKSKFGQDFFDWYEDEIVDWGVELVHVAKDSFKKHFPSTDIAIKIAGIHWQYFNPNEARSAELCAGYKNYDKLISAISRAGATITFTAIEQNDERNAPFYSGALTLAKEFYGKCKKLGARCFAENALAIHPSEVYKYNNMREIMYVNGVEGLTYLRYTNLIDGGRDSMKLFTQYVSEMDHTKTILRFQVDNINTAMGESFVVVGSIPALGNWNPANGVPLANFGCNGSNCRWAGSTVVPGLSGRVEWQLVKAGKGPNGAQCTGTNTLNVSTRVVNVAINSGRYDYTNFDVREIGIDGVGAC
ncbi:hypothetical protein HDU85_006844 [Gaertneriomyces sp. JEL0708]|nr:hypothetical protein HDU85_006844 [Gaertneriomyces sp. JEL0708]